jgi:hypothetical protein
MGEARWPGKCRRRGALAHYLGVDHRAAGEACRLPAVRSIVNLERIEIARPRSLDQNRLYIRARPEHCRIAPHGTDRRAQVRLDLIEWDLHCRQALNNLPIASRMLGGAIGGSLDR